MTAAHVIVTDNQRHTTDSVVTDIDGTFAIPLPEPGVVTIGINAPGYIAQTLTHIKAGHPYLTIQMKHDPLIIDQVVVSGNLRRTPAQKIRSWFRRTFHRRDQKG